MFYELNQLLKKREYFAGFVLDDGLENATQHSLYDDLVDECVIRGDAGIDQILVDGQNALVFGTEASLVDGVMVSTIATPPSIVEELNAMFIMLS